MTPSLTLDRERSSTDAAEFDEARSAVLSLGSEWTTTYRSRRALLRFAITRLSELATRQGARHEEPYAVVLRLIHALIGEGSATPQIADNGEGGIEVLWLVNRASLTIDYESEFEILLTGVDTDGARVFAHTVTAYWTRSDAAVDEARQFLAQISTGVVHAIPLG